MEYTSSNKYKRTFLTTAGSLLFFMMLVFPYIYMEIKVILILIVIIGFFSNGIDTSLNSLTLRYKSWILVYFLMNFIYFIYGVFSRNPGVNNFILTYLVWPILYFIFCTLIDEIAIRRVFKVSYVAYIVIIIIGILSFLQGNGYIPNIINTDLWNLGSGERPLFDFYVIYGGFVVSFIFLFPFYITMYIIDNDFSKSLFNKIIIVFSFVFAFATSRRALIMSILYLPFIIYFFYKKSIKNHESISDKLVVKRLLILFGIPILLVLIFSIYIGVLDLNQSFEFFSAAFDTNSDDFGNERSEQAVALINGWYEAPIFGSGPGVDVAVVRSETPGIYELSYLAILFSRGIFGFSIYVIQFFMLLKWGIKLSNLTPTLKSYFVSYNVAFVSFLISNASNPYLDAFDHLWILFLFISLQNIIFKLTYDKRENLYIN